jgi:pyruvate/2-oxoglutarate dehydrogenase complex dihydrolipoamide acyltransferase (E2) component
MKKGYTSEPLTFNRKMLAASASVTRMKNTIHCLAETDVTEPRRLIQEHFGKTGEKLSLTAYLVTCLAQVIRQFPRLNSFIRRNRLIILDEVTISVLVERELAGEKIPEPVGIEMAQRKTCRQISKEIRNAQAHDSGNLGGLSGMNWIRFIPGFLLKTFVRLADKNLRLAVRYGKVAVTSVGMFSSEPLWFIPHGSATVLLTVGSIEKRMMVVDGKQEAREYLCITGSFDHNIVDGAPAARFMNQFLETVKSGRFLLADP